MGPLEKANTFNDNFASVFTLEDNRTPRSSQQVKENVMLSDFEFSPVKVYRALRSLKSKCSYGPDGLPVSSVSHCHSVVIYFLFFTPDWYLVIMLARSIRKPSI
jgi:hypothetical protein